MHRERRGASRVSGLLGKAASAHGGDRAMAPGFHDQALCIARDSRDFTVDSGMQAFGCHVVAGAPGVRPATRTCGSACLGPAP